MALAVARALRAVLVLAPFAMGVAALARALRAP